MQRELEAEKSKGLEKGLRPPHPHPQTPLQTISAPSRTKQKQEEKGERRGGLWVSACGGVFREL